MTDREDFQSFIPPEKTIPELTIKAILIGIFLAIILGAANAYLGLYAGMTVSAIIPGAVMALALLRPFKGTILEVNLATMGASAGECIAAGVIFTIPALVILGVWTEINYLETTLISLLGGLLGVLWMVPLRRALVVKTDLPFPEGVAVAAVLTTTVGGERTDEKKKSGISGIWLGVGALVAGLFKFCELSLNIFRGTIEHISSIGKYKIGENINDGWLYGGVTISPALLGVGWIIGTRIASYVLVGGLLGWVIIAPIVALANGLPAPAPEFAELGLELGGFYTIWANQVRFIGVGTMLVGGLWAIWAIRMNLAGSIKEAIIGIKGGQVKSKKRTDKDASFKLVFIFIVLMTIPVFLLYMWLSDMFGISLIMAIITIFFAFIASALAGYLTGLVGSSNMPISGVTVAVLLIVSLIMLGFGVTGAGGMAIVIFISAVIAVGGSISGDLLQSMACGQMLGATPRNLQISMTFGVLAISGVVGIVIGLLHKAFRIGSTKLVAPQAGLMAGVVKGVLGGEMLWPFVLAGMILALVLILIDLPVLPVAIGIYLPFTLSIPIFTGGVIRYLTDWQFKKRFGSAEEEEVSDWELAIKQTDIKPKEKAIRTGLLFTAGLVAGEALTGVIIAILVVMGINLAFYENAPWLPGLIVWIYIAALLAYIPIREIVNIKTGK
jgi:putative OPT family oligopeptide transporter